MNLKIVLVGVKGGGMEDCQANKNYLSSPPPLLPPTWLYQIDRESQDILTDFLHPVSLTKCLSLLTVRDISRNVTGKTRYSIVRNISCSISFSSSLCVISRKLGLLVGQCMLLGKGKIEDILVQYYIDTKIFMWKSIGTSQFCAKLIIYLDTFSHFNRFLQQSNKLK